MTLYYRYYSGSPKEIKDAFKQDFEQSKPWLVNFNPAKIEVLLISKTLEDTEITMYFEYK